MASSLKNVIFVQAIFFVGLLGFDVCSLRAFDERTDQVDRIFLDVDKKDSPGASISILHKGDVVYRKSYGMANLEHGVPISTKTIFDIAIIGAGPVGIAFACAFANSNVKLAIIERRTKKILENPNYLNCISTHVNFCLLYTSPSPRDGLLSRMPSSA